MTARRPYNPFIALEEQLPHVFLCTLRLPQGRAWWLAPDETIVLDDRLDHVGRRCALAHEIEHVTAGDVALVHVHFRARQEIRATARAARKLIRIEDLVDALRITRDEQHLADLLEVDVEVLRHRVECITASEQDRVEQALEESA